MTQSDLERFVAEVERLLVVNDSLKKDAYKQKADAFAALARSRVLSERRKKALEPLMQADVRGSIAHDDGRLLGVSRSEIDEAKAAHDAEEE